MIDNLLWSLILRQAIQVSIVAVFVWIASRIFARDRPHLAHALWALVLLKCVTPPIIPSPTSPFCWLGSNEITRQSNPNVVETHLDHQSETDSSLPVLPILVVHVDAAPQPISQPNREMRLNEINTTTNPPRSLVSIFNLAWLLGAVFGLLWTTTRLARFLRRVQLATMPTPLIVQQTVERLSSQLAVRNTVSVRVVDAAIGPAVVGFLRPTILLPSTIVQSRSVPHLEPLIAHELIHIRRGDLKWALLQTVATSLCWFHPLAWLASQRLNREAERSCDEETIASLGCKPANYARSLLDVLEQKHRMHVAPALPGVRPVDITLKRMERIMRLGQGSHQRSPRWVSIVFCIGASVTLPGAAWVVGQESTNTEETMNAAASVLIRSDLPLVRENGAILPSPAHANTLPILNDVPLETVSKQQLPTPQIRVPDYRVERFEVADLIKKLCDEQNITPEMAKAEITCPLPFLFNQSQNSTLQKQLSVTCEFTVEGGGVVSLGGDHPTGKVVGDTLYLLGTEEDNKRMEASLQHLRDFGLRQVVIETRLVSIPADMMEKLALEWTIVSPVNSDAKTIPIETSDGQQDAKLIDEPSSETIVPVLMSVLNESKAQELLAQIQANAKSNILAAPKITMFNGQEGKIYTGSERPFVVSVQEIKGEVSNAYQPIIRTIAEGLELIVKPVVRNEEPTTVALEGSVRMTEIAKVNELKFKQPGAKDNQTIALQVPVVNSQCVTFSQSSLENGTTLVVSGLVSEDHNNSTVTLVLIRPVVLASPITDESIASQGKAPPAHSIAKRHFHQAERDWTPVTGMPALAKPNCVISAADDGNALPNYEPLQSALRIASLSPELLGNVQYTVNQDSVEMWGNSLCFKTPDAELTGAHGKIQVRLESDGGITAQFEGKTRLHLAGLTVEADECSVHNESLRFRGSVILKANGTAFSAEQIEINVDSNIVTLPTEARLVPSDAAPISTDLLDNAEPIAWEIQVKASEIEAASRRYQQR